MLPYETPSELASHVLLLQDRSSDAQPDTRVRACTHFAQLQKLPAWFRKNLNQHFSLPKYKVLKNNPVILFKSDKCQFNNEMN